MKIFQVLTVFMMMLLCSGKAVKGNITDVYTEPNQPTDIEVITIVVFGLEGSNPVLITDSDFQMEGNSVEINIFLFVGYYGMITPWSHSEIIGTLPAGEYNLTVNAYYSGAYTGTDTHLTSFIVVPTPVIEAEIDINPNTLNLQSKGKWLTCHIWLPEDYDVADVNSYSVFLEDAIEPNWIWLEEQDQVVIAKFSRLQVQELLTDSEEVLQTGQAELTVTGRLLDGTMFEGTDTIKVINKPDNKSAR